MNSQKHLESLSLSERHDGIAPPPRALMIVAIGGFLLMVTAAIVGLAFLQNRPPLSSLLIDGLTFALLLTMVTLAATVIFRRRLPRRLWAWTIAGAAVLWLMGLVGFILIYQNVLAPGQRETTKFYLPFMTIFDPAHPAPDNTLPTAVAPESGLSPADLLNAPLSLPTRETVMTLTVPALAVISPTPLPTDAWTATPTPTPAPTSTPIESSAAQALPATQAASNPADTGAPIIPPRVQAARLYGFTPVKQTWNNCGPANITMALSYYGWRQGQETAAAYLKPDREDKNVSPWEMVAFVNDQTGVRALTRVGGTLDLLKDFLANEFPVIIETGYMPEGYDWIGHYQTLVGYDDAQRVFYLYDSYLGSGENGAGLPGSYEMLDRFWSHFNRTFIVLYRQDEEDRIRRILGDWADPQVAAERAAATAQEEARRDPKNGFAWFNLGSSLTRLGRYQEASAAFDQARRIGVPWRMTLYQFGPFEAYFEVGRYSDVLALVDANLNNGGEFVEETHYWKGQVLAAQGNPQEAAAAFRRALSHNPRFVAARDALSALNL